MDYRDTLQTLVEELRHADGLTAYQIAERGKIHQQILSGVLRKERNLSPQSLSRLLDGLGYEIHFEKITSQASAPSVPNNR